MYPRIYSLLPVLLLVMASGRLAADDGKLLQGVVRYSGAVPQRAVADNAGRRPPLLEVDRETGGLAHAVVYLDLGPGESGDGPCADCPAVEVGQENEEFVPRVVALRPGQTLRIGNNDGGANHNARAVAKNPENRFSSMTPYGRYLDRRIHGEPGIGPIRLACDYHAWMTAWVYVFGHKYFAITDAQGRFSLPLPSAGRHNLKVAQPDGGLAGAGQITVPPDGSLPIEITFGTAHLQGAAVLPIAGE